MSVDLSNLKARIRFNGGDAQFNRMQQDKLNTLRRAMLYSYQAAVIELPDERKFRCLINSDKLSNDYDNKIISMPYDEPSINDESTASLKCGDIVKWKTTGSSWLVYLQYLEETAYFRANLRRCKYTVKFRGLDEEFPAAARETSSNSINWATSSGLNSNNVQYTLELMITKTDITLERLKRLEIIEVNDLPWEVQSVDRIDSEGIIIVKLKEYFKNTIEKEVKEEEKNKEEEILYLIDGADFVYPYDTATYSISGYEGGRWSTTSNLVTIEDQDETQVLIRVITGKSGKFNLVYSRENEEDIIREIIIKSL